VANGLAATARVITAAATIMYCVFAAFVFGEDRSLKMFGLGLATAVLRRGRREAPSRAASLASAGRRWP
jgi:uncharacterized membrane protein YdfJ with MMPL/SSD domain